MSNSNFKQAIENNLPVNEIYKFGNLSKNILKNSKDLINNYEPIISPVTNTTLFIPCLYTKLLSDFVCRPNISMVNGMNSLINVLQNGGNLDNNYNYIYDIDKKKWVKTTGPRGKEILYTYLGYIILNIGQSN